MKTINRREFVLLAGAAAAATQVGWAQTKGKLTAGEVVARIKQNLGIPWKETTYRDLFHIGGPEMPVTGIATSFGANFHVLEKAQKAGLNMLVVHEPTFWSDADVIDWVKDDPLYKWKLNWANQHGMVVWRIHDHWHARKPDGIREGWLKAMDWTKYMVNGDPSLYKIPPTTLRGLAQEYARKLGTGSLRVVGDPNLPVTLVGRGGHLLAQTAAGLQTADAILISECREYDSFEYVRDAVLSGAKKGAIFSAHSTGEDVGMKNFAEWSQPFLPEIPVKYIPTTDEFWTV